MKITTYDTNCNHAAMDELCHNCYAPKNARVLREHPEVKSGMNDKTKAVNRRQWHNVFLWRKLKSEWELIVF